MKTGAAVALQPATDVLHAAVLKCNTLATASCGSHDFQVIAVSQNVVYQAFYALIE
jgi:hypothetical protein